MSDAEHLEHAGKLCGKFFLCSTLIRGIVSDSLEVASENPLLPCFFPEAQSDLDELVRRYRDGDDDAPAFLVRVPGAQPFLWPNNWPDLIERARDLWPEWIVARDAALQAIRGIARIMDGDEPNPTRRWSARMMLAVDQLCSMLPSDSGEGIELGKVHHPGDALLSQSIINETLAGDLGNERLSAIAECVADIHAVAAMASQERRSETEPTGNSEGTGKTWASLDDRMTARSIERWRNDARHDIEMISGWRDADPSDRACRYWADSPRPTPPEWMHSDTAAITHWLTTHTPKLDPSPLIEVWRAVAAWHRDRCADALAPQDTLSDLLERSELLLAVILRELHQRGDEAAPEANLPAVSEDPQRIENPGGSILRPPTPASGAHGTPIYDDSPVMRVRARERTESLRERAGFDDAVRGATDLLQARQALFVREYADWIKIDQSERTVIAKPISPLHLTPAEIQHLPDDEKLLHALFRVGAAHDVPPTLDTICTPPLERSFSTDEPEVSDREDVVVLTDFGWWQARQVVGERPPVHDLAAMLDLVEKHFPAEVQMEAVEELPPMNTQPAQPVVPGSPAQEAVAEETRAELERIAGAIESLVADDDPTPPPLPELKIHDRQAWQLATLHEMTQAKVAAALNKEHKTIYSQGQVSRMIQRAKAHVEASGLAEKLPKPKPAERVRPVDPARLDIGPRVDPRPPRPSDLERADDD